MVKEELDLSKIKGFVTPAANNSLSSKLFFVGKGALETEVKEDDYEFQLKQSSQLQK